MFMGSAIHRQLRCGCATCGKHQESHSACHAHFGGGSAFQMKPKKTLTKARPDYTAMADILLQIAQDLRQQSPAGDGPDMAQAERLERIAAEMQAGNEPG